jgi:hypothetical protein
VDFSLELTSEFSPRSQERGLTVRPCQHLAVVLRVDPKLTDLDMGLRARVHLGCAALLAFKDI